MLTQNASLNSPADDRIEYEKDYEELEELGLNDIYIKEKIVPMVAQPREVDEKVVIPKPELGLIRFEEDSDDSDFASKSDQEQDTNITFPLLQNAAAEDSLAKIPDSIKSELEMLEKLFD